MSLPKTLYEMNGKLDKLAAAVAAIQVELNAEPTKAAVTIAELEAISGIGELKAAEIMRLIESK